MARTFILGSFQVTYSFEKLVSGRRMTCGFLGLQRGNEGFRTERELESDEQGIYCIQKGIFGCYLSYFKSPLPSTTMMTCIHEIAVKFYACPGSPWCPPFKVF